MHSHESSAVSAEIYLATLFALALLAYAIGVGLQRHRGRPWPWWRSALWVAGIAAAASGFVGPLAAASHGDFVAHTWAHLLVGMVAPVLLVLAAPVTLALRSLALVPARRVSRMLRSIPARILTTPAVAAALNVGGLWVLYTTPLFEAMQRSAWVHLFVMTHLLLAGYLFTVSLIPVDPAPHRAGYPMRAAVLVLALAAHGILTKVIYADPPAGVPAADAEAGAMLMFTAGDLVDAVIVAVLCARWYREAGRALRRSAAPRPA